MGRFRIKFHMSKKQKVLLEVGVAILGIILLLGALNTVTATYKTPILTTEDLWKLANVTYVSIGYVNSTYGNQTWPKYKLADIATYYDGYLYISIPKQLGYDRFYGFSFWLVKDLNGTPMTFRYLVDRGINHVYVHYEVDTNLTGYELMIDFYKPFTGGSDVWYVTEELVNGTTIDKEYRVDTGAFLTTAISKSVLDSHVMLAFYYLKKPPVPSMVKLRIEIDAVSKKPVLKSLTEPIYSVLAGMWSAFLGLWRRVKSIVASAFGGFGLSTIFTGLIGDPIVALIISVIMVSVFFLIMRPRR